MQKYRGVATNYYYTHEISQGNFVVRGMKPAKSNRYVVFNLNPMQHTGEQLEI